MRQPPMFLSSGSLFLFNFETLSDCHLYPLETYDCRPHLKRVLNYSEETTEQVVDRHLVAKMRRFWVVDLRNSWL